MTTGHNDVDHAPPQNGATLVDRGRPCIWIRVDAELTVITISGEIDASDIDDMSPYARRLVRDSGVLIIDLSGVDFITVGGLRALLTLWSADQATTESPRAHVMRICSEHMTVELRRGG
jgi:ABC-type transporter Mla MlaB component